MLCFPNAKINLGLHVTKKRNDGFHNIETIFYPVGLSDILEWIPNNVNKSNKNLLTNSGLKIDGDPKNNLCIKAYELLSKDFELPKIHIHLHKIIPFGAGLGGGSSDAAFMLKSINNYYKLNLSTNTLSGYSRKLGSDCAFFIENKPVYATERGDHFEEIQINLRNYHILIIHPGFTVSTKEAYSGITPKTPLNSLKDIIELPIKQWKNHLSNDFEKNIFKKYPKIKEIKEILYTNGAIYASMTGSGSAVFGLFDDLNPKIINLFPNYFVWKEKL